MDTQVDMKCEALPESTEKRWHLPKINRRAVTVACAVLLIAAAVALNFMLFGGDKVVNDPAAGTGGDVTDGAGDTSVSQEDKYFSATQVSRQRARDEALEVLQSVVNSEEADEATKTGALLEISELARAMEAEANIETLVIAKGFAQCVAVINGDTCSVVVKGDGELSPSQISQINEIVYEQAKIEPINVKITER